MSEISGEPTDPIAEIVAMVQPGTAFGTGAKAATFWFIAIEDRQTFGDFVGELGDGNFLAAKSEKDGTLASVSIGFSASGLRRLGFPESLLRPLGAAFNAGMAHRAGELGDAGPHAPATWQPPLGRPEIHALVTVWRRDPNRSAEDLLKLGASAGEALGRRGCRLLHVEYGRHRTDATGKPTFPFGFRDGLSMPASELDPETGKAISSAERAQRIAPFFLSLDPKHKAAEHGVQWRDAVAEADARSGGEAGVLRRLANAMLRGGTFVVYRKITANPRAFDDLARASGLDPEEAKARMIGRRKDGTPLLPASSRPETPNDFDFADDPDGAVCPLGSHIRRANPRAGRERETGISLQFPSGETRRGRKGIFGRHTMLRRGIAFAQEEGLHFLACVADIDQQFEFIQREWINKGDFIGQPLKVRDVIASTRSGETTFDFGNRDAPNPKDGMVATRLRGGEYFFLGGQQFLRMIARGHPDPSIGPDRTRPAAPGLQRPPLRNRLPALEAEGRAMLAGPPVILRDGRALIARHAEVMAVLADGSTFSSEHYRRRIRDVTEDRDFALGMPLGRKHDAQRDHITSIIARAQPDAICPHDADPFPGHDPTGTPVDLLFGLVWRRLVVLVETVFGATVPEEAGPAAYGAFFGDIVPGRHTTLYGTKLESLYPWRTPEDRKAHNLQSVVRTLGAYIIGVSEAPSVRDAAEAAAREFNGWLPGPLPADQKAVGLGLAVAACGTIAKASGHVFDALLTDAAVRAAAETVLARKGARPDDLRPIILEVLRLNPVLPVIRRDTTRETHIGGTRLPARLPVLALIGPALRDPAQFGSMADRFDPTREFDGRLVFGNGPHACLGRALAPALIARIAWSVLKFHDIDAVAGPQGGLLYSNPLSTDPLSLFAHLGPRGAPAGRP